MKTNYTFRTVVALVIRAVGLVAIVIGVFLLLRWLLIEVSGGSSGPYRLYAVVGLPSIVFGVICRIIARWLLRSESHHDNAA